MRCGSGKEVTTALARASSASLDHMAEPCVLVFGGWVFAHIDFTLDWEPGKTTRVNYPRPIPSIDIFMDMSFLS